MRYRTRTLIDLPTILTAVGLPDKVGDAEGAWTRDRDVSDRGTCRAKIFVIHPTKKLTGLDSVGWTDTLGPVLGLLELMRVGGSVTGASVMGLPVGLAVGLLVVGFRVGLLVVGLEVGLLVVGLEVGLLVVGFGVGGGVVGLRVGFAVGGGVGGAGTGARVGGYVPGMQNPPSKIFM